MFRFKAVKHRGHDRRANVRQGDEAREQSRRPPSLCCVVLWRLLLIGCCVVLESISLNVIGRSVHLPGDKKNPSLFAV